MKFSRLVPALLVALALAAAPLHFKGKVLDVAETKLAMETTDGNVLTLYTGPQTRILEKGKPIKLGQLREGDTLDVDVTQNAKGSFVILEARLAARTSVDEDAAPPRLARRPNGESASSTPPATTREDVPIPRELKLPDRPEFHDDRIASGDSAPMRPRNLDPRMELIERARDAAEGFSERLPNYVCQQMTTRYLSQTRPVNWQAQDVVTASIVYEDGKEDYRNIAINGHPQNKKMEQLEGNTSTGEFGTILRDIFHPATQAHFKFVKEAVSSRVTSAVYDFDVAKPNSHWDIKTEGKEYSPAFHGTVWIDSNNARVLRIEMEALNMPEDFPIDMVQTAVDYDYVSLGTERFLLPTRSESLSCERGTINCSKNVIEWRNYHKYLGESKIIYDTPKQ